MWPKRAESENEGSFVSSYVNMSLRHWRKRGVVYPSCKQDEKSHIQARKKAAVRTRERILPFSSDRGWEVVVLLPCRKNKGLTLFDQFDDFSRFFSTLFAGIDSAFNPLKNRARFKLKFCSFLNEGWPESQPNFQTYSNFVYIHNSAVYPFKKRAEFNVKPLNCTVGRLCAVFTKTRSEENWRVYYSVYRTKEGGPGGAETWPKIILHNNVASLLWV